MLTSPSVHAGYAGMCPPVVCYAQRQLTFSIPSLVTPLRQTVRHIDKSKRTGWHNLPSVGKQSIYIMLSSKLFFTHDVLYMPGRVPWVTNPLPFSIPAPSPVAASPPTVSPIPFSTPQLGGLHKFPTASTTQLAKLQSSYGPYNLQSWKGGIPWVVYIELYILC